MKIRIQFKDPDALHQALQDAAREKLGIPLNAKTTRDQDFELEDIRDDLRGQMSKFFRFGEYVTLEFDTVTQQMTVVGRE